jgi:hypothetical protein
MLDGVGHVAQMEVPRTVARAVLGLLDEVAGGGASVRSGAERASLPPALGRSRGESADVAS